MNIFDLINVFVQVVLCPNRQEFDEKIIIEKKGNSKSNIGQIGDGKFLSIECFHVTTVFEVSFSISLRRQNKTSFPTNHSWIWWARSKCE